MIRDFTDDEARRALPCKWGQVDDDVIPAWVAEMDYALAPVIEQAVVAAVRLGMAGYPTFDDGGELGRAYAGFAQRHFGQEIDPDWVLPTVDVTAGRPARARRAQRARADGDAGAGVRTPARRSPSSPVASGSTWWSTRTPSGPSSTSTGWPRCSLPAPARCCSPSRTTRGAGCSPAPSSRACATSSSRHGARVVSDEIHAPLVLPGAEHVLLPVARGHRGPRGRAGRREQGVQHRRGCAARRSSRPTSATRKALRDAPMAAQRLLVARSAWSAAVAAYTHGDPWLAALVERLDQQRTLLGELLAEHLPEARMRPLEGTYLAWLDLRAYGHADPAAVVLTRGRVRLSPGHDYQPGLDGHVRLNIATSPERLTEIVRRMASALGLTGVSPSSSRSAAARRSGRRTSSNDFLGVRFRVS